MTDVEIKRRRRTTKQELAILEDLFKSNPNPPKAERARVCELIDMPPRKLQVWLQNRRQKEKKDAEKWKPASYTSDGVKVEEASTATAAASSVPCVPSYSSSGSGSEGETLGSTSPPPSSSLSSSSIKPHTTLRLPPLAIAIGNVDTEADVSLSFTSPAPLSARPSSASSASLSLSARSYSLPLPPTSAPPCQMTFPHTTMSRTLTEPGPQQQTATATATAASPIYDRPLLRRSDSALSLSSTKDGRAKFGQSIQLPSLSITTCGAGNGSLTVAAAEGEKTPAIISPVDELLSKLQSDPVEPEQLQQHERQEVQGVLSPIRRRSSVRMEDILGSHRKQRENASASMKQDSNNKSLHTRAPLGRAYTAPQPLTLPTSAIPFPTSTRTLLGSSTALFLSRSNSNTSTDSNASRKKRTYSYANASILQRSISYDSLQANKENIPPSSASSYPLMYQDSPSSSFTDHLAVQTRPLLSRSRSYQDRTTSSSSGMLIKKKQRTAASLHSSEAGSDFDELENDDDDQDEPDLTFSTVGSSSSSLKKARAVHGSSRQSETEASDSEFESGSTSFSSSFTSSLGTSFPFLDNRSSHNNNNMLAPIRGLHPPTKAPRVYGGIKAGNENQLAPSPRKAAAAVRDNAGSEEDDEDMSREEVDCAAVLLGFGRT